MKSAVRLLAAAASLCILAPAAHAASVTLDFEGLDGGRNGPLEEVANFYNGGLGSKGSGPGPNFGITIRELSGNPDPRVICNDGGFCDNPAAGNSLFVFGNRQNTLKDPGAIIHVEGGFRGIVEFDASISNFGPGIFITTKTDLDNPSNITIDVIQHPDLQNRCFRLDCEFVHYTINLADDIFTDDDIVAHDIIIRTDRADAVFFDNIKFHDIILPAEDAPPVAIAEPSSALMMGGAGLIAAMWRRRRTAQRVGAPTTSGKAPLPFGKLTSSAPTALFRD